MSQQIRVLIADDHAGCRSGLRVLLSASDEIEVIGEAGNGREAVDMVESSHPDVVLMDARMPVMDGFNATRIIKANWPKVRTVLLTMYSDARADALAAGADAFVVKGHPIADLMASITP